MNRRQASGTQTRGYILENQVTHARLLPVESSHAFTYPTIAFLMSLDALEHHKLDLWKGWLFGYGGLWGRVTGVRTNPYLADVVNSVGVRQTIREKLDQLLMERGYIGPNRHSLLNDAWMLTMPNYLGFEGINPLTVYFCYKAGETALWLVVLEVHNTFGETHVYLLEVGQNEDPTESRPIGYDHQWTLPREFHVSPFNDRSGFYTISVKSPSHPPTQSQSHTNFVEFSAWSSLRWGGGVKWQGESPLERYARLRVHQFLQHRVEEVGLHVSFVSADTAVPDVTLSPRVLRQGEPAPHLVITYLAPRFFTILLAAPSPQHALLIGSDTDRVFQVSSRELFTMAFSPSYPCPSSPTCSPLQHLRAQKIPPSLPLPIPALHPLDPLFPSCVENLKHRFALHTLFFFERVERWMFFVMRARVVEGDEPWEAWTRAEKVLKGLSEANAIDGWTSRGEWGSVRNA
ncbi:hypothetical protein C0993_010700 [Termitomyces sp. T159_Od127]|nr:hypothetical protein C0993_010700 [Termitomyces sp. T159_Od127]